MGEAFLVRLCRDVVAEDLHGEVLLCDTDRAVVHRVPTADAPWAADLALGVAVEVGDDLLVRQLIDAGLVEHVGTTRRQILTRTAGAAAVAGVASIALPSVAAASSPGDPYPVGLKPPAGLINPPQQVGFVTDYVQGTSRVEFFKYSDPEQTNFSCSRITRLIVWTPQQPTWAAYIDMPTQPEDSPTGPAFGTSNFTQTNDGMDPAVPLPATWYRIDVPFDPMGSVGQSDANITLTMDANGRVTITGSISGGDAGVTSTINYASGSTITKVVAYNAIPGATSEPYFVNVDPVPDGTTFNHPAENMEVWRAFNLGVIVAP